MNSILRNKLEGMEKEIKAFSDKINVFLLQRNNQDKLTEMIKSEMEHLGYDIVEIDKTGNIIGILKGYRSDEDMVLLSNIDLPSSKEKITEEDFKDIERNFENDKSGIVTSIYTGAVLKRSLAMLTGDLIVACNIREKFCGFGTKYLFTHKLKNRKFKGVVLCEPTGFNIYIGNKGRLEYEIIVRDHKNKTAINEKRSVDIEEINLLKSLHEISDRLPIDNELGRSVLLVKNVQYEESTSNKEAEEIHFHIDRTFVPSESDASILLNAKNLASRIYGKPSTDIDTHVKRNNIETNLGGVLNEINEYKPWKMEGSHPFIISSLSTLQENDFPCSVGYWKKIITEGSFTNGELKIPTLGFGAGKEGNIELLSPEDYKKSIFGKALIIYRQIGIPTFGWDGSEI